MGLLMKINEIKPVRTRKRKVGLVTVLRRSTISLCHLTIGLMPRRYEWRLIAHNDADFGAQMRRQGLDQPKHLIVRKRHEG